MQTHDCRGIHREERSSTCATVSRVASRVVSTGACHGYGKPAVRYEATVLTAAVNEWL